MAASGSRNRERPRAHRCAEIEDGARDGFTLAEEADIRELKKRNRLLEQENEVLRRAAIYLGRGVNPK